MRQHGFRFRLRLSVISSLALRYAFVVLQSNHSHYVGVHIASQRAASSLTSATDLAQAIQMVGFHKRPAILVLDTAHY